MRRPRGERPAVEERGVDLAEHLLQRRRLGGGVVEHPEFDGAGAPGGGAAAAQALGEVGVGVGVAEEVAGEAAGGRGARSRPISAISAAPAATGRAAPRGSQTPGLAGGAAEVDRAVLVGEGGARGGRVQGGWPPRRRGGRASPGPWAGRRATRRGGGRRRWPRRRGRAGRAASRRRRRRRGRRRGRRRRRPRRASRGRSATVARAVTSTSSSASASGVPARRARIGWSSARVRKGMMAETARAPVPAPRGSARIAAPRRRRRGSGADAGEEGREVDVDDAGELGLGRRKDAQELGQALGGGEGGDGERAEEAAAVVEDELEVDARRVDFAAGRRGVGDEAVHGVALVEEAGEARVLARSRRRGRGAAAGTRRCRAGSRGWPVLLSEDALDPLQRVEEPADDEQRAVGGLRGRRRRRRRSAAGLAKGVGAGEARAADAAEGLERWRRGRGGAGACARHARGRARRSSCAALAHHVEAEELAVALEEDRRAAARCRRAPELAEEQKPWPGGRMSSRSKSRDLDLARAPRRSAALARTAVPGCSDLDQPCAR